MMNSNHYGQPQLQRPASLYGRVVSSLEEINFGEVPMDGSIAIFPKADFSEIYAKQMTNTGKVVTVVFKPQAESRQSTSPDLQNILARLEKLESQVKETSNESNG